MKLRYNDDQHAYWIDGKRCKSVTALASIPDDKYNLNKWERRQVAIGLARSPHLLESVAAHHTDKGKLDALCEEAKTAAGAGEAAEWGTAAHRVTERIDQAEAMIETDRTKRIRETYLKVISDNGLTVVPDMRERIILYPERHIAGKFDLMLTDGSVPKMSDVKTGNNAVAYPHSIAVQMAVYANAPLLAGQFNGLDGETDVFEKLPEALDKKIGFIIHMPNPDVATIFEVNIAAGWKTFSEIILPTLDWRARTGLVRRLTPVAA